MSVETKVAKINGKFVLIAAVITGVCTIISSVISNNVGKEKAVNEVIAQTTDSIDINSIDELITKYNQLSNDNLNLKEENITLSVNNTTLTEQNNSLLTENASLKDEAARYLSLEENYNILMTENDSLKVEIEQLNNELQILKESISDTSIQNDDIPEIPSTNIGKKVSIFDLETFQGHDYWFSHSFASSNFVDTYGNEYLTGCYTYNGPSSINDYHVPTYLLNYKYSTLEGKIAWSKQSKNITGSIWVDFYTENGLLYSTPSITAIDEAITFEFSIKDIKTLIIVCNGSNPASNSVIVIYPYLNLIE